MTYFWPLSKIDLLIRMFRRKGMYLILKRMFQTPTETIGKLVHGDEIICYTLEDIAREPKVVGETRIPAGTYQIKKRIEGGMIRKYRERFGNSHYMLWLQNVPNFQYIMIHIGNTAQDSSGCVLAGTSYEEYEPDKYRLLNSTGAYLYLWNMVDKEFKNQNDVYIIIIDEEDG